MPDPYSTPADLRVHYGADELIAAAPQGTYLENDDAATKQAKSDAYWVVKIEEGDRWLDGQMTLVGQSVPPASVDRSEEEVATMRHWSVVAALYFGVLPAEKPGGGVERMWELLKMWLAAGAPMGDGDGAPVRHAAVAAAPESAHPLIPAASFAWPTDGCDPMTHEVLP